MNYLRIKFVQVSADMDANEAVRFKYIKEYVSLHEMSMTSLNDKFYDLRMFALDHMATAQYRFCLTEEEKAYAEERPSESPQEIRKRKSAPSYAPEI